MYLKTLQLPDLILPNARRARYDTNVNMQKYPLSLSMYIYKCILNKNSKYITIIPLIRIRRAPTYLNARPYGSSADGCP